MPRMLSDTFRALFRRPVTQRFPAEVTPSPPELRGELTYSPDKCTGCALCVKDCPANAIKLITLDKAAKRFVMEYHIDRCTFCGQCVQSCRFDCITLAGNRWALASATRDGFTVYYGKDEDVRIVVEGQTEPEPESK